MYTHTYMNVYMYVYMYIFKDHVTLHPKTPQLTSHSTLNAF